MTRRIWARYALLGLAATMALAGVAGAADSTKVDRATKQVEQGAKEIGAGNVGHGAEDTATGIGNTVVEGAKYSGDKIKDAAKAAEQPTKNAGNDAKEGAASFGTSVKNFFNSLFSK